VSLRAIVISLVGCLAITFAAAWLFDLSLERSLALAPAFVIGLALIAAVCLLLARAAVDSIRDSGHPRLVTAIIVAGVALVAVLTVVGVELPRE
jgi:hypothetical protein